MAIIVQYILLLGFACGESRDPSAGTLFPAPYTVALLIVAIEATRCLWIHSDVPKLANTIQYNKIHYNSMQYSTTDTNSAMGGVENIF